MAQLGSRLFFLVMDSDVEVTVDDLVASETAIPYRARLERVRAVLQPFLSALVEGAGGIRSVPWDATADPEDIRRWIARLAAVLAAIRSEPVREGDPDSGRLDYSPAKKEQPRRAYAVLRNLARGHALVHGRAQVSEEDLPLLARVVMSSMPSECGPIFARLVRKGGEPLTTAEVRDTLRVQHLETARKCMEDLGRRDVMQYDKGTPVSVNGHGTPDTLRFRPSWEWCSSPEFQRLCLS